MRLIRDKAFFTMGQSYESMVSKVAAAFAMCYKNEKVTHFKRDGERISLENRENFDSNIELIQSSIAKGHESPLEHVNLTAIVYSDCAISREFIRHRHTSVTMESTRYCNYAKNRFGNQITFIAPPWVSDKCLGEFNSYFPLTRAAKSMAEFIWLGQLLHAENSYMRLLKRGWTPEKARIVLPLCTKTEYMLTANVREWKTIFDQRLFGTTGTPHPQAKNIAAQLHTQAVKDYSVFFPC